MCLGVFVECREDDGEEGLTVVSNQTHNIVITPVVQRPLCNLDKTWVTGQVGGYVECMEIVQAMAATFTYLKMRAGDTAANLLEQRVHDLHKLNGLHHV